MSFIFTNVACERKTSNKASVSIQFPEYKASVAQSFAQSKTQEQAQSNSNTHWGLSAIKDYSAANCYAVVATGPNINTTATCEDASGHQVLELGDVYGQFPAGSTKEIQTSAGTNRTFSIIAFYSKDPSCQEIIKNPFNSLISSRPLILGKAVSDISPGDNSVEINLNLTEAKEIETCKGPLFESFKESTWPNLTILKSSPQLSLASKTISPSSNTTPTLSVTGILEGDKIEIFSQAFMRVLAKRSYILKPTEGSVVYETKTSSGSLAKIVVRLTNKGWIEFKDLKGYRISDPLFSYFLKIKS